ncbi:phage Gp37/Gp68 family protein [Halomonas qaidamensis]|uniref:Phage Gp37/Gp68 family protein n=1 Tax=Halomonas qaidamensis TaxID=2866211 RepID=A0ABY6JPA1_9GAMM|nr:phage Gp37/Gp68 family protein [Halomonas qaidamensis]UYV18978.1 phage Gp37/Gp68 family protein [Halomonas qaidamensis]
MSSKSSIEWTEHTWNPMTGCTKVSPGCKHCYAEEMAKRLQAMGTPGYENGFELSLLEDRLEQPFRRKKPTKYFVNSMSDLFHEAVPVEFLDRVFDVIRRTPHHTYQILTKRAERMSRYFETIEAPTNAWIGVSVEDKKYGVPRIQHLRDVAATVRFLSVEPLLEDVGPLDLTDIHWVIVGGESGRYARPLKEEWVNQVRQQCEDQGVAFFFKQWGTWGADGKKRNKKANGRELQGKVWDEMPRISALHL